MYNTCFRPTPSGHLHLGHVLVAYHNCQLARARGGTFVLMIDDVAYDKTLLRDKGIRPYMQTVEKYEQSFLEDLNWLGLTPDRVMRCTEHSAFHDEWAQKLNIRKPEPSIGTDSIWSYPARGLRSHRASGMQFWTYDPWAVLGWAADEHQEHISGGAWGADLIHSAALYHWFRVLISGVGPGLEFLPVVGRTTTRLGHPQFLAQQTSKPRQTDFVRDLREMGHSTDELIKAVMQAWSKSMDDDLSGTANFGIGELRAVIPEGTLETHEDGPASV